MPMREAGRVHARARKGPPPHPLTVARRRAGVSLAELARRTGLNYVTLWRIEKGRTSPSTPSIHKIERALGSEIF